MLRCASRPGLLLLLSSLALGCGDDSSAETVTSGQGASGPQSASSGAASGGGGSSAVASGGGGAAPEGDPVIVAVGYGHRRMRSLDLGLSWVDVVEDDPAGGDDENLLRATTWANGLFVAVGWRIRASADGAAASWTEHTVEGQQWCGGAAHGNGIFLCAGGCGEAYRSDDGLSWEFAGDATSDCGHLRTLAFGNGVFVAAGDGGIVTTSSDGSSWSEPVVENIADVVFRNGEFVANGDGFYKTSADGLRWDEQPGQANVDAFGHGVYLRGAGQGHIERSLDGSKWEPVYETDGNDISGFSFGYLP
jgi:hypothetical protein